jgi:hypothetical protein
MSDPYVRDEPANEVLDLYDVVPDRVDARPDLGRPNNFGPDSWGRARATDARSAEAEDDPVTSMIKGTGRSFAAIMGMFALSLTAFVACAVLFSLGLGLLVLFVGLFILAACLIVAGWSSRMSMALLGYAGITLPRTHYPAAGPGLRGKLRRLAYPQSWRDLLHVLINFILSTITFSVALTWVSAAPWCSADWSGYMARWRTRSWSMRRLPCDSRLPS